MVSICAAITLGLVAAAATHAEPVAVPSAEMATYEKGFSAVQQKTRTFQAELRQTLHLQGVSAPIVSLGTVYYAAPDKLLIRFSQPAGEWMLVNGSQIALKKTGQPLDRREQGKASSHAASLLDFFRSDAARWQRDFEVTMTQEGDLIFVKLKPYLTPTAPAQGVDHIVTTLQLPGYELAGMEVAINADNRIDYEFRHEVRNLPLGSALFAIPTTTSP